MIKRVLVIVGSLLAMAALAACGVSSSSTSSSAAGGSASSSSSSSASGSQPGKGKPPITIGDKNFTEEFILGDLYAQALRAKGFTVNLKPNIGSSELMDKALTSGQIQMYPEYTGVILSVVEGKNTSRSARRPPTRCQEVRGGPRVSRAEYTPFFDADALATLKPFAQKNHLTTIADLKKLQSWSNGGPPENKTRYEGIVGIHKAYGLNNLKFVPLTIGLQYQALDSGNVDTADVFTTDGQLKSGKYTILTDTKHIFGFQNVAPVVSTKLLARRVRRSPRRSTRSAPS